MGMLHVLTVPSLLQQLEYDQLMVNILMEGTCVKDEMKIDWKADVRYEQVSYTNLTLLLLCITFSHYNRACAHNTKYG